MVMDLDGKLTRLIRGGYLVVFKKKKLTKILIVRNYFLFIDILVVVHHDGM